MLGALAVEADGERLVVAVLAVPRLIADGKVAVDGAEAVLRLHQQAAASGQIDVLARGVVGGEVEVEEVGET